VSISEGFTIIALLVAFVAVVAYIIWRMAGWAAGRNWRIVVGFLTLWILTTIVGGIVFLAMVSIRQRRAVKAA
jgi:uncharacterized membrane protein